MTDRRSHRGPGWALAAGALAALSCSSSSKPAAAPTSCQVDGFQLVNGGAVSAPDPGTACLTPVGPTALPSEVIHHGQHAVGDTVAFFMPLGARSVSIVSQAVSAVSTVSFPGAPDGGMLTVGNSVVPSPVWAPTGQVFDDNDATYFPADPSQVPVYYGGESVSTGAMTLPDTTPMLAASQDGGLPPGSWSFVVNDWAYECYRYPTLGCSGSGSNGGVYDVTVLARTGPSAEIGTLDASVYLVTPSALGGTGLTAAKAVSNPDVVRMVSRLAAYLAKGGVCLGKVTFYDVPSWALTRYASLNVDQADPCSPIAQMFTLSGPGAVLDVFLVDEITSTPPQGTTYQVVGQDGTIPGPASVGGTVASGVVVSAADLGAGTCAAVPAPLACGDDEAAYVTAHETGHFLGLYHDTEGTGDYFDPIADTPMCPCTSCAPAADQPNCAATNPTAASPYLMQPADCSVSASCGGADDLMFWLLGGSAQGNLTEQQAGVMRANPIVR